MISLYRGELHRVSGVPRQWIVPKSQIPLSVFRNALKKRNAALLKFLQPSSLENSVSNALVPVANGTAEESNLVSMVELEELETRGEPENDAEKDGNCREDPEVGLLDGKYVECSEQVERAGETERRQERKRKREEDTREESGRNAERNYNGCEGTEEPETLIRGKSKMLLQESEPMDVDSVDRREIMECDVKSLDEKEMECDEEMCDQARVRVSETGMSPKVETVSGSTHVGSKDTNGVRHKEVGNFTKDGDSAELEAPCKSPHFSEESKSAQPVKLSVEFGKDLREAGLEEGNVNVDKGKKRKELEAKLEKLTAEKHRLVLMLKQVLNEEESKKRGSSSNASQHSSAGVAAGPCDSTVITIHAEKHGVGGLHISGDLEEGELEYARTPSPPPRPTQSNHGSLSGHNPLGPLPSLVPILGRQSTLSQHMSQASSGRGGYYGPGIGIPPTPLASGMGGGGSLSPGTAFIGNLPSPLGPHSYSHNLALQHAAAIHAQKIAPLPPGHAQFSPIPPSGGPKGSGPGIAGGPPGFGGYAVPPSMHPHHPHMSQSTSSSSPHIAVQQGVVSSSLLTTPRGPGGYHDMRLGGGAWIPR